MAWNKQPDWTFIEELTPEFSMNKKYSKHLTEYYVDPEDDWFYYVVTRVKKDRKMNYVSMIIRKDVPSWVSYYKSLGWVADQELNFNQENE